MDKNAIKKYAVWARRELISRVSQKALQYGITEENIVPADAATVNGVVLSNEEKKQRRALIEKINNKGYQQVMEEVAYTWFNRFIALRFMEVNGYLPSHVRVFTDDENDFKPQIITEAIYLDLDGLDMSKVYSYKDSDQTEELYKYLLIVQCNALNKILPGMFQKISDYTELLLPDNLLREGSVIEQMICNIPEDDFNVKTGNGQIEIIGWLYQYYISEKHEEAVNLNKVSVKKEDIPAATQLFTTDWVVKYIVDNTVGRYWIERTPESSLAEELEYYIPVSNSEQDIFYDRVTPQDITVFDPCMGSGHFLVYAFEVLMKIYVEYGYTEREAAENIVLYNIYGLDIDERASQLAYFSIMMKACQYDRRFFKRKIQPNIFAMHDSTAIQEMSVEYFSKENKLLHQNLMLLIQKYRNAKEFGTMLYTPDIFWEAIRVRLNELDAEISLYKEITLNELVPVIQVADVMAKKYAIVITNPPYLNKYNKELKKFVVDNFKDYSSDLFSVFMYRNFDYCKKDGYVGFMTPNVWMFLQSYEKLRNKIEDEKSIISLIQFAKGAFFQEATVDICAFVLSNNSNYPKGDYFRLEEFKGNMDTQKEAFRNALVDKGNCNYWFSTPKENFKETPGRILAYWVSKPVLEAFKNTSLGELAAPRQGMAPSDSNRFLRLWHEVNYNKIGFGAKTEDESILQGKKWYPYNKGGLFRKWYGNQDYIVNWENGGFEVKEYARSLYKNDTRTIKNQQFYFKECVSWSKISSGYAAFRYYEEGFIFSDAGMAVFSNDKKMLNYISAFLNSSVCRKLLEALSPTMNFEAGHIQKLPMIIDKSKFEEVNELVDNCIMLAQKDWDEYENSWHFHTNPICSGYIDVLNGNISEAYGQWCKQKLREKEKLFETEKRLNEIFITIYGLEEELKADSVEKDLAIRKTNLQKNIKELISYAVGCMFGRYSLDEEGLIFAGGEWDDSKYSTFKADRDSIIPICDDEYFEDDIVNRFVRFIEVVYGKKSLEENLQFIADALGGSGQPRDVLRKYFMTDFYTDHLKMYQKRPIYWLFDSGKKNGFKALVYMHRYQPDTIARMRTDYVHEQQSRYRTAIADLEQRIASAATSERVKLNKKLKTLKDQAAEIQVYEEKIHHLADQYISIDLDDGVKVNYAKFQDVLAKIK